MTDTLRTGSQGAGVADLHSSLQSVGLAVAPDEVASQTFGPSTAAAVKQFQQSQSMRGTGIVAQPTAAALAAAVQSAAPAPAEVAEPGAAPVQVIGTVPPGVVGLPPIGVGDPPPPVTYVVTGTVSAADSASVAALTIRLVDKNVGGDVVLADAQSDATGAYTIRSSITAAALSAHNKSAPDLQAQLMQNDAVAATSIVRYGATTSEQLDIVLAPGQLPLPSEYDALTSAISAVYTGSLAALQENAQQQDITYLANKTGWDARAIAMASQAAKLAATPAAGAAPDAPAAPFYYALLRAGLPSDPTQLHSIDAPSVQSVWSQAISQNVLPNSLSDAAAGAATSFASIGAAAAISAAPSVGSSTLGGLLADRFDQDEQKQQAFASLLFSNRADPDKLWSATTQAFGADVTTQLQLDGQLAYLTVNNAPLRDALTNAPKAPITSPVDLVAAGYHESATWLTALANIDPPPEFAAETPEQAKSDYADALSAHVRLSFPTATIGQVVATDGLGVDQDLQQQVSTFLSANQSTFDIGSEPVAQYLSRTGTTADSAIADHVARIQRLYQITPNIQALTALTAAGVDSAYSIARRSQSGFVHAFGEAMGGPDIAALVHSRATTVHVSTLHVALAYVSARRAPVIGATAEANLVDTTAGLAGSLPSSAIFAAATLEDLFGSLDFSSCDDCRSITSPAAYLVDLLDYLDNDSPTNGYLNPLEALLQRRPDIGALPLTCENTNTAQPYLDLVNEILECYVGADDSLAGYAGHNTDGTVTSAELIAAPQNDDDATARAAYAILEQHWFPLPLPFDRDLALLRAHVASLGSSLYDVLRVLRPRDTLDPQPDDPAGTFGWRDVLLERIGMSPAEFQVLTDSAAVTLQDLYGYEAADDVVSDVSVLQEFSRRTGVSYDDIVSILQTRCVNPESALLPLLQALNLPVSTLQQLDAGTLDADGFVAQLPAGIDPTRYGGTLPADIATWVTTNYDTLMQLIVIDVTGSATDTTAMTLRHLDPDDTSNALTPLDLYRLLRFIRIWRKLGLDIPTTDDLIQACFVATDAATDTDLEHLDSGFAMVMLRCGLAYRAVDLLGLDPQSDLESLLTCWGPMSTNGPTSLYSRLFLNPTVLGQDPVFAPDIEGQLLAATPPPTVLASKNALCAALTLTSAEFDLLTGTSSASAPVPGTGLGFDATTALTIDVISSLYRHSWLARVLQISLLELLCLAQLTGIDPFAAPVLDAASEAPVTAPLLDFVELVQSLASAGVAPVQMVYLLWNADLSGVSAPPDSTVPTLAAQLRAAFAAIDAQFSTTTNTSAAAATNLMALVLGPASAGLFFGLLTGGYTVSTPFGYDESTLPSAVMTASAGRLGYDDLNKLLTFAGYLDPATSTVLQTAAGTDDALVAGIVALADAAQQSADAFFAQHDDATLGLQPLFDAFFTSTDAAVLGSVTTLLDQLLPLLAQRRKELQALAVASAAAACDPSFGSLLEAAGVIPSVSNPSVGAVADLTAVGIGGLTSTIHLDGTLGSAAVAAPGAPTTLDYGATGLTLPPPSGGATSVAATWTGFITATQDGSYALRVTTDAGATLAVEVAGVDVGMAAGDGTHWSNSQPIALSSTVPAAFTVTATKLTATLQATWESTGTGWQPIPAANLYAADAVADVATSFLRFLKVTALAADLSLSAEDMVLLATRVGLDVGGAPWTARLAVDGVADAAASAGLLATLRALLTYASIRAAHAPSNDRLVQAVGDVVSGAGVATLASVTGWDPTSLAVLSEQLFGHADLGAVPDLLAAVQRLGDAFAVLTTCQLSAATVVAAATNTPTSNQIQAFQAAVRSRYAEADWLTAVHTINDGIRTAQRDALVAYVLLRSGTDVLQALGVAGSTNRLPTADDLFNYFLVDVEMAPCMETSRIRHALSSVQLFIERCLRNLEPTVSPNDIDGTQWVWRSRYRVWQANREVFLWPENWMDESLRDDKSPFFKTAMSHLLQGDITDESAATTYLDYLTSLEQVAKLEPCGLYVEEATDGSGDDVVHVVSRSSGAHRKHYYRKFEAGSWTPWEDTKLTIDDNPVVPYIWNGRLLLFWTQVHHRSTIDTTRPGATLPSGYSGEPELGARSCRS